MSAGAVAPPGAVVSNGRPRPMRRPRVALLPVVLLAVLAARADGADLLVRNARLVDGTGAPPRGGVGILVRDGRIAAIAPGLEAPGVPSVDAAGGTVIPGLVDAHVHLGVAPGSELRGDTPAEERALRHAHLRAYLACGVTTVLDTAIDPGTAREIQAWLRAGHAGPRVLLLGPGFVTPGGYLADVEQPVATPADVEVQFEVLLELGAVGAKVFVERGFGPTPVWPIPSDAVRAAIVAGAERRKLPLYVHANREDDKDVALDMGAHAILHAGFYRAPPSPEFVARMARSGTYLVTTFAVMDARLMQFHPERLADPLFRRTVPAVELATAGDPASGAALARREVGMSLPWLPGFLAGPLARVYTSEAFIAQALANAQRAAQMLWAAGVPLVSARTPATGRSSPTSSTARRRSARSSC